MKRIKIVYKNLSKRHVWGLADTDKSTVELHTTLKGKKHLEILTHETLHILLPQYTEEEIVRISTNLTQVLWKDGYRKVDNSNLIPMQDGSK
jgi:hypothetical protein